MSVIKTTILGASLLLFALIGSAGMASTAGAVPKAPKDFLGIVPQEGVNRLDTQRMKRGKVTVMRVAIGWDLIQPTNAPKFNWNGLDETVRVAAREGVRVMPTLYATPKWLSRRTTDMPDTSHKITKWRKFIKAAVNRYGTKGDFWTEPAQVNSDLPRLPIRDWQIWNEANFHYFATPVSPAKYGRLLDASASVIRANDPRGRVVTAGLFARPRGNSPKMAMNATTFIKRVAKNSKRNSIDSLALHPYAADVPTLKRIMRQFRNAANSAGLRSKPMQVTEIGWGSGRKTNAFLTGSPRGQAKELKSSFTYLIRDRRKLKLEKVYWFAWQDTDPKGINCSFCYTIGLFEHRKSTKLVAKPAWRQFVKFTRGRP